LLLFPAENSIAAFSGKPVKGKLQASLFHEV